ncbi:putative retinoblastoma-associated protein-like [Apostichopus japonicus]|uniref:Putative retinoblastoma-associated protein-like n=1 Tax=Stichopus japonicus TaxID=307972 RepID=A0A2G8JJS6_STIJA|nr:putative retinoblastoma-associated protein-like [Apostichopus japonicus]
MLNSTYKQVRLGAGETGHIIKFYNDVFVPAMKTFILSQHSENHPNSPVPHRSPSQQKSYKVHPNFTVSPLRHSPFKSPDLQRQAGSSAAVTPISNKLQNFNKTYGTSSKRKNDSQEPVKSRKKLNMVTVDPLQRAAENNQDNISHNFTDPLLTDLINSRVEPI